MWLLSCSLCGEIKIHAKINSHNDVKISDEIKHYPDLNVFFQYTHNLSYIWFSNIFTRIIKLETFYKKYGLYPVQDGG